MNPHTLKAVKKRLERRLQLRGDRVDRKHLDEAVRVVVDHATGTATILLRGRRGFEVSETITT